MVDDVPLSIEVRREGGATILRIAGELDVHTASTLGEALDAALDGGATAVEIDASGLVFCDSSGIQVLIQARERATGTGGSVVLTGVHGSVEKVLTITGVLDLLT